MRHSIKWLLPWLALAVSLAPIACSHHDDAAEVSSGAANFAAIQSSIISAKCSSCHSGSSPAGGLDFSTYAALMATGSVIAGNPEGSTFLTAVTTGNMPPGIPLSADLVQSIKQWIKNGALLDAEIKITSVTPDNGAVDTQVSVTIDGQGFQQNSAVTFGANPATTVTFVSSNRLTAISPHLSSGTYDVTVADPDGTSAVSPGAFKVGTGAGGTAPSISKIFPTSGASGTLIEIDGDNFLAGATVTVGGQTCGQTLVIPPGKISCLVPRQDQSGPADIIVMNPDKTAFPFFHGFIYTVAASYTSILKNILIPKCVSCHGNSSPAAGIILNAYNQILSSGVVIPRDPANSSLYTDVLSHAEPRAAAGKPAPAPLSDAEIATIFNWILNGAYNDTPPSITKIVPNKGSTNGGSSVTITGTGFLPGVSVSIGNSSCTPATVNIPGTTIQCVTSPASAGIVDVVAINAATAGITPLPSTGGAALFTYAAGPTITSISPNTAPSSTQSPVTVSGTNFQASTTFKFGNVFGTNTTAPVCDANHNCTMTVVPAPQPPGLVTVRVTNPSDGQFFDLANAFNFTAGSPPVLSTVSPTFAYTNQTPKLTLTGSNFLPGATVTVAGKTCNPTNPVSLTPTQIQCNINLGNVTPSAAAVVVKNPDQNTNVSNVTLNVIQAITITSVSDVSVGGGTIVIDGLGFIAPVTVTVGGTACTTPNVIKNGTEITCNAPPSAGLAANPSVAVVVKNPKDANNFIPTANSTIVYTMPTSVTVGPVSPSIGSINGGDAITVNGTGFAAGSTVKVGGAACTSPLVTSATTITCTTPAHAAGAVDVVVTNTDSVTGTDFNGFTYQ